MCWYPNDVNQRQVDVTSQNETIIVSYPKEIRYYVNVFLDIRPTWPVKSKKLKQRHRRIIGLADFHAIS